MDINRPVATVILLIINAMLVFLFTWPEYNRASALELKLREKQAAYNGQSIYYANISKTLSDIESRSEILTKVESALPNEFVLAPLLYFFQKKGTENGLAVKNIVFSRLDAVPSRAALAQTAKEKEVEDTTLTLDVFGNYQGLKNFLSSVERSARIFEVRNISFNAADLAPGIVAQGQVKTYNFKLEIVTHSY